jgi:tocopherol O-methyltransferase
MISLVPGQDYRSKPNQGLQDDIIRYYDECYWDYRTSWLNGENLAIHYGYWDPNTRTHSDSLLNLNRVLAETADIRSGERVLDAGCGIGGSSIWLARHRGARVTGITLSQPQAFQAGRNAERHGIAALVDFKLADFCATPFADESFDVIWGIESICHALDKRAFIREAHRLLRPGGRLVCSDGYARRREFTEAEWQVIRTCLDGWEIPNLATPEEFSAYLATSGFRDIRFADVTASILPSSKRLRRTALLTYPMQKIMTWLRLRTPAQSGNFYTALHQYRIFTENLACYGVFCAVK